MGKFFNTGSLEKTAISAEAIGSAIGSRLSKVDKIENSAAKAIAANKTEKQLFRIKDELLTRHRNYFDASFYAKDKDTSRIFHDKKIAVEKQRENVRDGLDLMRGTIDTPGFGMKTVDRKSTSYGDSIEYNKLFRKYVE